MSWSRRSAALALVSLGACGFTPAYGPAGVARGLLGQIAVDPPRDRPSYFLVRRLEERLGRPSDPAYRLAADLNLSESGLGATIDDGSTRSRVTGRLDYRLIRAEGGDVVSSGRIDSFVTYASPDIERRRRTIAGNPVTVRVAREDAVARLMTILADDLVARLLATAPDWRQ